MGFSHRQDCHEHTKTHAVMERKAGTPEDEALDNEYDVCIII